MASNTTLSYYFQTGTHAGRPATPNVPANITAFYYETDTLSLFYWTGSAWTVT